MARVIERFLQRNTVERGQWQAGKAQHAIAQRAIGLLEREALFGIGPVDLHRIGQAPMRGDRLAGPCGAFFVSRLIANGKNEIKTGRVFALKLGYMFLGGKHHVMVLLPEDL